MKFQVHQELLSYIRQNLTGTDTKLRSILFIFLLKQFVNFYFVKPSLFVLFSIVCTSSSYDDKHRRDQTTEQHKYGFFTILMSMRQVF